MASRNSSNSNSGKDCAILKTAASDPLGLPAKPLKRPCNAAGGDPKRRKGQQGKERGNDEHQDRRIPDPAADLGNRAVGDQIFYQHGPARYSIEADQVVAAIRRFQWNRLAC